MNYEEIKKNMGYCGLSCGKCIFYRQGEIRKNADSLRQPLGDFDRYAERFSSFDEKFRKYPEFKEFLEYLTEADCDGCRAGKCKYPNCGVQPCASEKGIDFCFQCDEFPCENSNFDEDLKQRWIAMNNEMEERGVEAYCLRVKDEPRYR